MRRVLAIAKNTFVFAIRMKMAVVFILILIVVLPMLSVYSTGDGTIKGKLQSFVSYSMGLVSFLLSLLTVIVSSYCLCSEIKNKHIYMTITKPVRRWEMILGKIFGVLFLNMLLLVVFSSVVFILTLEMPKMANNADMTERDKLVIENEFFTARKALKISFDKNEINASAEKRYEAIAKSGNLDGSRTKYEIIKELRLSERLAKLAAQPGGVVMWEFENVKISGKSENIYIKFKCNASKDPPDKQIVGTWYVGDYRQIKYGQTGQAQRPIYTIPVKELVGTTHEFLVPAEAVASDGYLAVAFHNAPSNHTTVLFPEEDGLSVLYKSGTFSGNFVRGIILVASKLIFLTVLGVSFSTWLSYPVAIMCSLTIFLIGSANAFVLSSFGGLSNSMGVVYTFTLRPILWLLPKFDGKLNMSEYLISAEMIGIKFLLLSVLSMLLKAFILVVIAVLIFRKREIAKISV